MISSQRRWFGGFAAVLALFPTSLGAQTVAQSFDELQGMLKVGQTVVVTDEAGGQIKGKVADMSASSLTVLAPEKQTFAEGTVTRVNRADGLWKGTLIGLGAGAFTGLVLGGYNCNQFSDTCVTGPLLGASLAGAIGAAIGAGVDALVGKVGRLIYMSRAQPSALSQQQSGAIVSPLVGKGRQSVLVSVRF